MRIRLIYFDFPFWRAETSRLALHIGGIDFEDVRPDRECFRRQKEAGVYPYGQLPVLEVDGERIAQSTAIAVYCGKLAGLYPDDPLMAARVDELLASVNEITYAISPSVREPDVEAKRIMRKRLGEETLPHWFALTEARLNAFGSAPFVLGADISVADLALWRLCAWLNSGLLEGIPTRLSAPHRALSELSLRVSERPDVKGWMSRYS